MDNVQHDFLLPSCSLLTAVIVATQVQIFLLKHAVRYAEAGKLFLFEKTIARRLSLIPWDADLDRGKGWMSDPLERERDWIDTSAANCLAISGIEGGKQPYAQSFRGAT